MSAPLSSGENNFRQVHVEETARVVTGHLGRSGRATFGSWEQLTDEERGNITDWVELVFLSQIEAYGPALRRLGIDDVGD
jgi:hypothetical protein